MKMKNLFFCALAGLFTVVCNASNADAHCEIPCGIYDDGARINLLLEHTSTIEKSMKQILQLRKEEASNYNQLVRWIMNKEEHATKMQQIVSQYFMTQRIKPDAKEYAQKLILLHKILVYAMKCKQSTELAHVQALRGLVEEFKGLYLGNDSK